MNRVLCRGVGPAEFFRVLRDEGILGKRVEKMCGGCR